MDASDGFDDFAGGSSASHFSVMPPPTTATTVALAAFDVATHSIVSPVRRRADCAGGDSASHFSVATPPAAGDATETTTSAAATLADSSSPDVAMDTIDSTTAAAASAVDTGVDADTDPSAAVVAPPTTEHISSFLLHIRRPAAGDDAASSSPDMAGGSADGATATAASAADSPAVACMLTRMLHHLQLLTAHISPLTRMLTKATPSPHAAHGRLPFRRRKRGVVRAGRHTKHVAKLSMPPRRPEPPAHHRLG